MLIDWLAADATDTMNCQKENVMLRFALMHSAITAGCLLFASTALAQFTRPTSGGSSGYGAFGNRTIGGGTNPGTSGFSAGASSTVGGNGQLANSGAQGASSLTGANNPAASGNTQMRDMRQERQRTGFVGADNSDAANIASMQGMQQSQMQMNSLQSVFSQFSRQNQQRNQNRNQNQQGNKKQLRISIKADIPLASSATAPTALGRQFEARLTKLPGLEKQNDVQVRMEGRTAVLSGSVASDRDRSLVEGLALLEPGISAVRNELVVGESGSTVQELPAPRR